MSYVISAAKEEHINISPTTTQEEVVQNVWFLLSTMIFDIPLDRELGLNAVYIDKPIETAKALVIADIFDKIEAYEPRANIVSINFKSDHGNGVLKPIVEVDINDRYNEEEYS